MPKVSRFFQSIPYDINSSIIWHSIFGRPMLVGRGFADFLRKHSEDSTFFTYDEFFGKGFEKDEAIIDAIDSLSEAHILLNTRDILDSKEKKDIDSLHSKYDLYCVNKIENLSLIMSEECPFRCKYCIHFANSEHQHNPEKMMSLDVAELAVESFLYDLIFSNGLRDAYINFGGGEPLLNWEIIEQILPYIKARSEELGIEVKLGINTNLALLNKHMAKTLLEYGVEFAASLDGTKAGNDSVRLTKNLKGTYKQIMRGFDILKELGHPLDGFAMTVTEDNFFDIDTPIIDWAASLGMTEVRIDIDVLGTVNMPISEIVSRLMTVRKYARTKGISVIGFWSRPAENLGLIPEDEDVGFCGGERGNSICVVPSGQVFPCGYSNYKLGDYYDIPFISYKEAYRKLLNNRSFDEISSRCNNENCPILGFCRGGCMITREASGDNPAKLSRMCELYRAMTYEILRESVAG